MGELPFLLLPGDYSSERPPPSSLVSSRRSRASRRRLRRPSDLPGEPLGADDRVNGSGNPSHGDDGISALGRSDIS